MSMSKSPTLAQKKKRLVQLRDAQRRRRERLREDNQHFVQIILPEKTLAQLTRIIAKSGETMQQAIARLVQTALPEERETPTAETQIEPSTSSHAVQMLAPEESIVESPTLEPETFSEPEPIVAEFEEPIAEEVIDEEMENEELVSAEIDKPIPELQTTSAKAGQLDLFG